MKLFWLMGRRSELVAENKLKYMQVLKQVCKKWTGPHVTPVTAPGIKISRSRASEKNLVTSLKSFTQKLIKALGC